MSEEDLEFLLDDQDEPPQWAMAAPQKNSNADRFLSGLAIKDWDVEEFIKLLNQKATTSYGEPDEYFMKWLANKSIEWHQQFYALLYKELETEGTLDRLRHLNIVRVANGKYSNGKYSIGTECFFPGEGDVPDDGLLRVDMGICTSGKSKIQQDNARKLLEEIGVREVGEAEQIKIILKQRYGANDCNPRKQDLKRFIALVEKEPDKAKLFSAYYIFQCSDGRWGKPSNVFLDQPFMDTRLKSWYTALGREGSRDALDASLYKAWGIKPECLAEFAAAVGAQTCLEIEETNCDKNPEWDSLRKAGGSTFTQSGVNKDFHIPGLEQVLSQPSLALSKLVWETMCAFSTDYLKATYQKNQSWDACKADSRLVHCLRRAGWIPQGNKIFVRPAEALRDNLPGEFLFHPGWKWIKAIHFGQDVEERSEEQTKNQEMAKKVGFADADNLAIGLRFASLPLSPEELEQVLAELERRRSTKLPEKHPNSGRRAAKVREQAAKAPERQTELRTRSVSVEREAVKKDTNPYLLQQYTNEDGEMICQVCKTVLPFKLADGSYYFEAVEFLPVLKKRHYQNYLALCPNHAAMFQHVNGSRELLMEMFSEINGNNLKVVLRGQDEIIYFTRAHIADLRAVIDGDGQEEGGK